MIILTVSVLAALSISFLCSLLEATLLSLTPSQLAELRHRHPRIGGIWVGLKDNIEKPISAILIANTTAHTIGASFAGAEFDELFGGRWIWAFSLGLTVFMVQFTEILPKTLGVRFNRVIAVVSTRPLQAAIWLFGPIIRVVNLINRPFEARKRDGGPRASTLEEISTLAGLARLTRQINARQERIIDGASRLSHRPLEKIMIPMEQVSCLSLSQSMSEALIAAHIDAHTRFPVCEENDPDRMVGYVNFKEMVYHMRINPVNPSLKGIVRPIHFARSDESAADLLEIFVTRHIHLAIVRKDGRNLGLITLEDIVEELVGELEDELDHLPQAVCCLSGDVWIVGGGVPLDRFVEESGLALPETREPLADWIAGRCGHLPKPGESFREGELEITVRRVRRGHVFEACVSRNRAAVRPV